VHFVGSFPKTNEPNLYSKIYFIDNVDENSLILGEGEAILTLTAEEILTNERSTDLTIEAVKLFENKKQQPFTGNGILLKSDKWTGYDNEKATKEIIKEIKGRKKITYKLKD